ncbi:putative spermidine/putrescine transport system permease protein [Halopseudomonas litoralis]|uniref:Putative spermidine/putrescine transport system permease protein n=1 Tax=Halopseudomonas litoralis TaxID=797277 RepID=A0A1H1QG67_9GAMM|nr:ABC transporter permease [Halopseudomonas litoralis]SDS22425.1 putative spermidine/putrescine transport system permease protein [Halopseudomonas litoralis]
MFPSYATLTEKIWLTFFYALCIAVFIFLALPILIIIPLSFNAQPYFTFTPEMLRLDPAGFSLRWYKEIFNNAAWLASIKNTLIIGSISTVLATILGTMAALGLSRKEMPMRETLMALLISPMIVPVIISAAGMYFFFAKLSLNETYLGVILAHTVLGTPFVVITVTSTLVGFDHSLIKASLSLGASPIRTFFSVVLPSIRPGVISGGLFALATSFDEVVVVMFVAGVEQRTIPRQMWSGLREQISPTILAVATLLIVMSVLLLATLELMRRRSEKAKGVIA